MIKTVIMAGGSGSRLWPLSRAMYPKQFLSLTQDATMLQSTLDRVDGLEQEAPLIICNEEHRFIVAEQSRQIKKKVEILLEPVGRNTAPAVALAALRELNKGNDPILLVLAADHAIGDKEEFQSVVERALPLAESGDLVTFGVVPSKPETGYGYIRRGDVNQGGFQVAQFVEKPDFKCACEYVESGDYYWNSGMFLFRASRYIEELEKFQSDILNSCRLSLERSSLDIDFVRIDTDCFTACADISIDYAVMEKTNRASVVPLDAQWSDVGAWSSLWEISPKDSLDNSAIGDVLNYNSTGCHVHATHRLVSTVGLDNVVVVETKDAVLVANKNDVQDVKKIVEELKSNNRTEHIIHREVARPWGKYDSIDSGERYQVKRITVTPGAKLSVQMHHHRAEHWVVVAGTARVGRDDEEILLTENESVYLRIGCKHWLENPGKIPLELIEVQTGPYLGEDDIVRFSDEYGRT